MLVFAFGMSAVGIIEQFGLVKLDVYTGVLSLAGGINVVSSLGILIWLSICSHLILIPRYVYLEKISHLETRVWVAVVLSGIPALILFVAVTSMGAITDRFWQVAFMTLVSISFAGSWRHRIRWYQVLLLCTLVLVASVNVIFRYPLSNFFYPLVPYTFINPSFWL
jgi:glucose-6-phosphate-specific signal transduction histidine kinase